VLPDGSVSIPLAGSINAAGRSVEAVRGAISGALASNFASPPTVVLSVGQLAAPPPAATPYGTISVYTIGEINTPGRVDIAPGTTLLQFLSQSGGFTPFAATKRIQLRRADTRSGTEQVYNFNYKAIQNGAKAPTIVLRNGDVIIVPERRLFE
jgi:polysaccharide export outer membrane protein